MKKILTVIVLSQFFCTSVWFAGNAIIPDLISTLNLDIAFLAHLTSAVQFGFISGTLIFAILTISDRYSPSKVFFTCALLAGFFNLSMTIASIEAAQILLFRFLTGFFLAGIYPVGMKIASDYYQKGLGTSLGLLVGALVLGTAFPHLIKNLTTHLPWRYVVYFTSFLAAIGGSLMLIFVPNGPYRKPSSKFDFQTFFKVFKIKTFRISSFGYFGHMWELYVFWAFVPLMLLTHQNMFSSRFSISFFSFLIIGIGGIACVISGLLSEKYGAQKIAYAALFLSLLCCLASPFFINQSSSELLILFLLFWGMVVIADSPLFSTLIAKSAPEESRGTALTIVNCLGFTLTVISLQLTQILMEYTPPQYLYLFLAIGPLFGLISMISEKYTESKNYSIKKI